MIDRTEPSVPEELRDGAAYALAIHSDGTAEPMGGPYQVVRDFEAALCAYTGAPYAVTTSSCTAALLLAVKWHLHVVPAVLTQFGIVQMRPDVEIPRRTYVGVACSIIHAGGRPTFRDEDWRGMYRLEPYPIWDSARWFTEGLYRGVHQRVLYGHNTVTLNDDPRDLSGSMVCCSFHASKTLALEQGGVILHDDPVADGWLRRMRFDGRAEGIAPKDDDFREAGFHCYMGPSAAALGLLKLSSLPRHNAPLANSEYPDLSLHEAFR